MKPIVAGALLCLLASGTCAGNDRGSGRDAHARRDLYSVTFSDGSRLSIRATVQSLDTKQTCKVHLLLHRKGDLEWDEAAWDKTITTVDYTPTDRGRYYAVVAQRYLSRWVIYFPWNGLNCTFDRVDGQTFDVGDGDGPLEWCDVAIPLKLRIYPSPRSRRITDEEHREMNRLAARAERRVGMASRHQEISGAKLEKWYVIKFESRQHPDSELKCPLFVIAWTSHRGVPGVIGLDHIAKVITIDGHRMSPPNKRAVYALQPDYSLKELAFTEEEITRLFSHITRSEERAVSSFERELFPSDPYWEQKVDPHLKVVEPPQKEAK